MRNNLLKLKLVFLVIIIISAGYLIFYSNESKYKNQSPVVTTKPTPNLKIATSTHNIISKSDAIKAVENLPEVRDWEKLFKADSTNDKPVVSIESTIDNSYFIKVYEDNSGYISIFGWYVVDKKTGKVLEYDNSTLFIKYGPCYKRPEGQCYDRNKE